MPAQTVDSPADIVTLSLLKPLLLPPVIPTRLVAQDEVPEWWRIMVDQAKTCLKGRRYDLPGRTILHPLLPAGGGARRQLKVTPSYRYRWQRPALRACLRCIVSDWGDT